VLDLEFESIPSHLHAASGDSSAKPNPICHEPENYFMSVSKAFALQYILLVPEHVRKMRHKFTEKKWQTVFSIPVRGISKFASLSSRWINTPCLSFKKNTSRADH